MNGSDFFTVTTKSTTVTRYNLTRTGRNASSGDGEWSGRRCT
jgi:hypothetical protein